MTTPTGVIGSANSSPGAVVPGGKGAAVAVAPALSTAARPYIARLYKNDGAFKATLGPILNRPALKASLNAGQNPIDILVPDASTWGALYGIPAYGTTVYGGLRAGDIVTLTEQDGDGSVIYTGQIVDTVDHSSPGKMTHTLKLRPLVAELGLTYGMTSYIALTDIAQMVRDAVRKTAHLSYTPSSIPLSGILAVGDFSHSNALDVINTARRIGGPQMCWWVDGQGIVSFRTISTGAATHTAYHGPDFVELEVSRNNTNLLKNHIVVMGGVPSGGSAPMTSTYSSASSQAQFGVCALMPHPLYPTITDQATLDAISATLGAVFDRTYYQASVVLPAFGKRIRIGDTMRLFHPATFALQETAQLLGGYSPNFVVLDVETSTPVQKVLLGDMPVSGMQDLQYEIARVIQAQNASLFSYTPASLNVVGTVTTGGMQAASGGGKWIMDQTSFRAIDANGVTRIEEGNLAARGVSGAGWKMRTNDSNGNPIFDSDGIIQAITFAGQASGGGPVNISTANLSTVAAVTGSTVTFTLARQTTVMSIAWVAGKISAGTQFGTVATQTDSDAGKISTAQALFDPGLAQITNGTFFDMRLTDLGAGSHTVKLVGATGDNLTTLQVTEFSLLVLAFGA